jgi:hypothetical protein
MVLHSTNPNEHIQNPFTNNMKYQNLPLVITQIFMHEAWTSLHFLALGNSKNFLSVEEIEKSWG